MPDAHLHVLLSSCFVFASAPLVELQMQSAYFSVAKEKDSEWGDLHTFTIGAPCALASAFFPARPKYIQKLLLWQPTAHQESMPEGL